MIEYVSSRSSIECEFATPPEDALRLGDPHTIDYVSGQSEGHEFGNRKNSPHLEGDTKIDMNNLPCF